MSLQWPRVSCARADVQWLDQSSYVRPIYSFATSWTKYGNVFYIRYQFKTQEKRFIYKNVENCGCLGWVSVYLLKQWMIWFKLSSPRPRTNQEVVRSDCKAIFQLKATFQTYVSHMPPKCQPTVSHISHKLPTCSHRPSKCQPHFSHMSATCTAHVSHLPSTSQV